MNVSCSRGGPSEAATDPLHPACLLQKVAVVARVIWIVYPVVWTPFGRHLAAIWHARRCCPRPIRCHSYFNCRPCAEFKPSRHKSTPVIYCRLITIAPCRGVRHQRRASHAGPRGINSTTAASDKHNIPSGRSRVQILDKLGSSICGFKCRSSSLYYHKVPPECHPTVSSLACSLGTHLPHPGLGVIARQ